MKSLSTSLLAIVTAAVVIGMVTIGMQQTYAPSECPNCVQFKKLTHEFEKSVRGLVGNPDEVPPSPVVREMLQTYAEGVTRMFLGGPDTIPVLLEDYKQAVGGLLENPQPIDRRHPGIAFTQTFGELTNDLEKAVISAVFTSRT